jgi:hypothetical protein
MTGPLASRFSKPGSVRAAPAFVVDVIRDYPVS